MKLFKSMRPAPDAEEDEVIEGEREFSSVNKGLSIQNKITNWAVIAGVCALAAVLLYKYYATMYEDRQQTKLQVKEGSRTVATTTLPPLVMPPLEAVQPPAPASAADTLPILKTPEAPPPAPPAGAAAKSKAQLLLERRLGSDVRFDLDGAATAAVAGGFKDGMSNAGDSRTDSMAVRAVAHQPARAGALSAERAFMLPDATLMITRGKVIPCTLIPAIDTTLTGIVTCVTAEDTTGADNKVSLMDRGTVCVGKQSGGVSRGQQRVGIIWQRCETPQHVLVPLDSGATDALGRPGITGQVDNHFWDRFGAAIALSLITEIGPYLSATRQGGSNNTTVSFPAMSGPQDIMSEVLENTVDIPPTITAPQGASVLIYLAGDIDFRDVYQLEGTKQP